MARACDASCARQSSSSVTGAGSTTSSGIPPPDEIERRVREERLDFGLLPGRYARERRGARERSRRGDAALSLERLGEVAFAYFAGRHLLARLDPRARESPPRLLSEVPLALQYSDRGFESGLRTLVERELPRTRLRPALECETFPLACRAVRTGRYASILPAIAEADLPSASFARAPVLDALLGRLRREIRLAWRPRVLERRPRARRVLAALRAELGRGLAP
jgi:hypothetical protein